MMTEVLPCLLRIGDNVKKHKVFKLDQKQITIGRSGDVTYAILSSMISRCHAVIKQKEDNSWTITDNKSLNGVYVNGRQLSPMVAYTLQDGDMVQFGVQTAPDVPAEFIYKFYASLKVRTEKKAKRLKPDPLSQSDKATLSQSESSECDEDRDAKRKKPHCQSPGDMGSPTSKLKEQLLQEQAAKEAEYQSRLAQMEKLLQEKEREQMEVQQQLERERQEKEHQAREVEELRMKETAILNEMEDKEKRLEKEKEELRMKMQVELETSLKEREAALIAQLNAQKEALISEKLQIEESLQKEMAKALEEKDKELEQNLVEQKEKLEKVLEKKEMEQKMLEAQLNETKEKSETHALKAKEEVLSNFVDLMEMELQCSICNELFIKATSLNCSHTFCRLCINQWLKVKKECPNCRKPATSQMQAIALDSYIDKMVENLNEELKERRAELVAQRKVEQDKFDNLLPGPSRSTAPPAPAARPAPPAVTAAPVAPTRQSTRSTRGRGRGRGGSRQPPAPQQVPVRGAAPAPQQVPARGPPAVQQQQVRALVTALRGLPARGALAAHRLPVATRGRAPPALTQRLPGGVQADTIVIAGPAQTPGNTSAAPLVRPIRPVTSNATNNTSGSSATLHARPTINLGSVDLTAPTVVNLTEPTVINLTGSTSDHPETSFIELSDEEANSTINEESQNSDEDSDVEALLASVREAEEEEDSLNTTMSSDSDSVEGDDEAYYGGYGRCFKCGRRGHWANGCPY